ncbi:MAG: hypothetical protein K2V38_28805 [Gemmataceae bacterium]|nr:hypothetical protein [Gemmataceae bacterium]
MRACFHLISAAFIVLFATLNVQAQTAPDAKIAQTFADWKARRERFQSVRYTLSGVIQRVTEREISPRLKNSVIPDPPGGKEKRLEFKILLDFARGRFRVEGIEPVPSLARDRWVPSLRITAFNGTEYQQALPRDKNDRGADEADVSISKGNPDLRVTDSDLWPVFEAHGIVPTVDAPLLVGRLPIAHEAEDFALRGSTTHAGRPCGVLVTNPTGTTPNLSDELWVDAGRQSAIPRRVYFQGKRPLFRQDVEHAETPHGWLPRKWTHTITEDGKVMTIVSWTVNSFEADLPFRDDDFTFEIKPGMIVSSYNYPARGKGLDVNRPAKGLYRIAENGDWEPLDKPTGFTTTEGVQLAPETNSRRWWWLGSAVGALLLLLATVAIWRRRSQTT